MGLQIVDTFRQSSFFSLQMPYCLSTLLVYLALICTGNPLGHNLLLPWGPSINDVGNEDKRRDKKLFKLGKGYVLLKEGRHGKGGCQKSKKMPTSFMDVPCNASPYPWGQFVASKTNNIKGKTQSKYPVLQQKTFMQYIQI